jgi:hypothetical protein
MNAGYNRGGFQGGMGAMGMARAPMGMGVPFSGGFNAFNRGGMMGMRGGMAQNRGGQGGMVGPGMMGPMGAMGMGGMPMGGMGMPGGSMMGMGGEAPRRSLGAFANRGTGGFQQQPHFNPNFFQNQNQNQATGGADWGNPHGSKRSRPSE